MFLEKEMFCYNACVKVVGGRADSSGFAKPSTHDKEFTPCEVCDIEQE